jgi:hypothetical protein
VNRKQEIAMPVIFFINEDEHCKGHINKQIMHQIYAGGLFIEGSVITVLARSNILNRDNHEIGWQQKAIRLLLTAHCGTGIG